MPETLNKLVDELVDEVRALRGEIHRRTRWVWATIAAVVLVGALAVSGAYYLIQKNNEKFCQVVAATVDPTSPAPSTSRGRIQLENFRQLGRDLGCPDPGMGMGLNRFRRIGGPKA